MNKTPFHSMHLSGGAKMGEFAGFDMPLFYPLGVMQEHRHTRLSSGLFDISHMVHIELSGLQVCEFVSHLCPLDISVHGVGECKYTFFLNDDGCIIDDLIITRLSEDRFLIVANAGCAEKDVAHVRNHSSRFDVAVDIIPRAFVALQGPQSESVLESLDISVSDLSFMSGKEPNPDHFISRTGYTGEDGFEIAMPESDALALVEKLVSHDAVEWIGLGARDSLRLEAGLSLYGQDLDESTTPHEAGLLWAIPKSLREGGAYIGSSSLSQKIASGRSRMRVGLIPEGRPVRAGTPIVSQSGESIGTITSGGFGPSVDSPIALGMISTESSDSPLFASHRGNQVPLARVKLPFHPHNYKSS